MKGARFFREDKRTVFLVLFGFYKWERKKKAGNEPDGSKKSANKGFPAISEKGVLQDSILPRKNTAIGV